MAIATTVRRFLTSNRIPFLEHAHARTASLDAACDSCQVKRECFARSVLLTDGQQWFMAIVPLGTVLDLAAASRVFGRAVQPLQTADLDRRFPDCEPGCHPPLPEPYGLKAVVDERLTQAERVYFEAGSHTALVSVTGKDFGVLCGRAVRARIASQMPATEAPPPSENSINLPSDADVQKKLEQVYRLPAIPAVATQILHLVSEPDSTAKDLAELVEMDPSIAAQVIRYARSSFFGYRGNVDSIQTAITRVLGFDIVSNLALGIAAGKVFKLASDGPLGLDAFWKHAVYSATLVQALTRQVDRSLGVKPGTAYLCGLLHNFGVLLLGHLFQPEYYLLNKMCQSSPEEGLPDIERRVLGMGSAQRLPSLSHTYLGSWLMRHWKMPDEVTTVTAHHHDESYAGPAAHYVALVQLANALLARDGIADVASGPLPEAALAVLNMREATALEVYTQVLQGADELNRMARLIAGGSE